MKLAQWLSANKTSQRVFAERIGVTQGRVSQICLAGCNNLRLIELIAKETSGQVTVADFMQSEAAE